MSGALPDPADCAVAEVLLPTNSPWTARYAAFVPGAHQPVRRNEDYIVIARRPGQPFRPVLTIPFPFDEPGLELQDDPDHPDHLVVHRRCLLTWTTDGGRSFRSLPEEDEEILFPGRRRRDRHIVSVGLTDADIFVEVDDLPRLVERGLPPPGSPQVWRIPLDGGPAQGVDHAPPPRTHSFDRHEATLMYGDRSSPWAFLHGRGPPWESEAFLERWTRNGGRFLLAREGPVGPFTPVPLIALMRRLGDCPSC